MSSTVLPATVLAIRPATVEDDAAVTRLAALDSAPVPAGALLLGLVDGLAVAAVSVDTDAVVADPFVPTVDIVALLRQRAQRLRAPAARRRASRHLLARRVRGAWTA